MIKSLSHKLNNRKFAFINYISQLKFKALKSIIEITLKTVVKTILKKVVETILKTIVETLVKTIVETILKTTIVFKI